MEPKLKVYPYEDGFEIAGNREGLRELARVCVALAELPEDVDKAKRLGNHYHFDDALAEGLVEEGSTLFVGSTNRTCRMAVRMRVQQPPDQRMELARPPVSAACRSGARFIRGR